MAWSCGSCTFVNASESAKFCEICQTARVQNSFKEKKATTSNKASQQLTLFGTVAVDGKKKRGAKQAVGKANKQNVAEHTGDQGGQGPHAKPRALSTMSTMTTTLAYPPKSSSKASLHTLQHLPFTSLWERAETTMKDVFGISKLRFLQPQAVTGALKRQSQIIVMATGGGKSLCYQLPAVVMGGTTIVVSPLKALICDQVSALLRKGVDAAFLSSSISGGKKKDLFERLLRRSLREKRTKNSFDFKNQPPVTLLYCTPEQVKTDRFRSMLKELHDQKRLTGFAIDEAHSISEWGHDFRPSFLELAWLRRTFEDVPLMATTATATKRVLEDIRKTLVLGSNVVTHIGSFDRVNIMYEVRYKDALEINNPNGGAVGDLMKFVKAQHKRNEEGCSGIIYVHKQDDTLDLSRQITKEAGVRALAYHGGMKDVERAQAQEEWMSGQVPIAVATIAFGMGIDRSNVRYVVHWSISKTIENFYQESGRAGRDGLPSSSLVYYSNTDVSRFRFLAGLKKKGQDRALNGLEKMTEYCLNTACRRQYLLKFFGEPKTEPLSVCRGKCDYCKNPRKVTSAIEASSAYNDFSFSTTTSSVYMDDDGLFGDDRDGDSMVQGERFLNDDEEEKNSKGATLEDRIKKQEIKAGNGRATGFVHFKSRDKDDGRVEMEEAKLHKPVIIPEHLRKDAPDPLQHFERKTEKSKQSSDLADEASRLREELARMKAAREKLQAGRNRKAAPPPPPPPPAMQPSKRRRKR